jgi:hypothetical protein
MIALVLPWMPVDEGEKPVPTGEIRAAPPALQMI